MLFIKDNNNNDNNNVLFHYNFILNHLIKKYIYENIKVAYADSSASISPTQNVMFTT